MIEITGNIWDYLNQPRTVLLITTNGFVKKNGEAVMGRGCALEASTRFPYFSKHLGKFLQNYGNHLYIFRSNLWTFPVKYNWYEKADLNLIKQSAEELLSNINMGTDDWQYILPRPGCGNGNLNWSEVKPVIEFLPNSVKVITFDN